MEAEDEGGPAMTGSRRAEAHRDASALKAHRKADAPLRILGLPRYDRLGASSRLRMVQFAPYLEQCGISIDWSPFFSDNYLRALYSRGAGKRRLVIDAYRRRIAALRTAADYDLVWIEKEAMPWLPAWAERRLERLRIPYVVDLDDAIFHNYDRHRVGAVRRLLGGKVDEVMRRSRFVVAGNDYLAERARAAGAGCVEILPTVIDLAEYPPPAIAEREIATCRTSAREAADQIVIPRQPAAKDYDAEPLADAASTAPQTRTDKPSSRDGRFNIGWIGTPVTARHLLTIRDALEAACTGGDARVTAIGSGPVDLGGAPTEVRAWSEQTQAADIAGIDAGIMPLPDESWERGKCGYKLIQYMACGKPVVASPVGVNCHIVEHGVNGFLASTADEWVTALASLRDDPALRARMGAAARRKVEGEYSLQVAAPRLAALLREAAG
jgi:glycosyltransferase involved in cell wall biosynthesis